MSYQIVDAYSHCGISKYRPVENVQDIMRRNGVARAVLVQHLGEYDPPSMICWSIGPQNTFFVAFVC